MKTVHWLSTGWVNKVRYTEYICTQIDGVPVCRLRAQRLGYSWRVVGEIKWVTQRLGCPSVMGKGRWVPETSFRRRYVISVGVYMSYVKLFNVIGSCRHIFTSGQILVTFWFLFLNCQQVRQDIDMLYILILTARKKALCQYFYWHFNIQDKDIENLYSGSSHTYTLFDNYETHGEGRYFVCDEYK